MQIAYDLQHLQGNFHRNCLKEIALLGRLWHRKGRIYGYESNMKHGGNIWNTIVFPNSIKSEVKNPPTNLIQYCSKIEAEVIEISDSMAWECKLFTQVFIGFWDTDNMVMKVHIHT